MSSPTLKRARTEVTAVAAELDDSDRLPAVDLDKAALDYCKRLEDFMTAAGQLSLAYHQAGLSSRKTYEAVVLQLVAWHEEAETSLMPRCGECMCHLNLDSVISGDIFVTKNDNDCVLRIPGRVGDDAYMCRECFGDKTASEQAALLKA